MTRENVSSGQPILPETKKEELKNYLELNGTEVTDPDFKELEEYLALNPQLPGLTNES